jgi:hypothetical protein
MAILGQSLMLALLSLMRPVKIDRLIALNAASMSPPRPKSDM